MTTLTRKRMKNKGFRDRVFEAWYLYQTKVGDPLSQEWLAEEVSRRLGLKEPLTQSGVSRWMRGSVPKELRTIVALARALDVDPGWLAFGDDSQAPPPRNRMHEGIEPK